MILAGDIGGTKTNVALLETDGREVGAVTAQQTFKSADYDSLEKIIREFLASEHEPKLTHACFGVAGPVVDGRVDATNLKWDVSADSLAGLLSISRLSIINDLEATAYGIEALAPEQLHTLNEGDPLRGGNRALIAAGTGLGTAGIVWHEGHYHPVPSEGGHTDFAPRNALEIELLEHLLKNEEYGGHVSIERVLSGPGLFNLYSFLRAINFAEEPAWLAAELASAHDAAATVSAAALAKRSELAVKALDMFVEIYGAMTGNLALLLIATGGCYVGGGIAPKIMEKLKDGAFLESFLAKGRFRTLLASMPVHVILDDKTALYGAARKALQAGG
ncbi:MAG: glucokinase [Blastocatellia bacterium]|jgi:glucokinase|nr:glucokinase [Blastocatellia bacterium]